MPNETWQSDFTHYRLAKPATDVEIISWLDDCTRYALHVTGPPTASPVRSCTATFRTTLAAHGIPASTLTDNGMVYTVRLAGGRGGRNTFEHELRRLHVVQKNSRPAHPTTCGKVERFQQTMKKWLGAQPTRQPAGTSQEIQQRSKKWLRAQPAQPATINELQVLIDAFVDEYNHHPPHRSLPHRATPAARYDSMPKALPGDSRDPDTHGRIRHDRVDKAGSVTLRHGGRLHHIGVGRTYAGTCVILLVQDLNSPRRQPHHRRTTSASSS